MWKPAKWRMLAALCAASGVAAATTILVRPAMSKLFADLGSALSGYATFLAAIFAGVLGSRELTIWRKKREEEKAAQIAGDAVVAVLGFVETIARIAERCVDRASRLGSAA
jgi:hypothetical protein